MLAHAAEKAFSERTFVVQTVDRDVDSSADDSGGEQPAEDVHEEADALPVDTGDVDQPPSPSAMPSSGPDAAQSETCDTPTLATVRSGTVYDMPSLPVMDGGKNYSDHGHRDKFMHAATFSGPTSSDRPGKGRAEVGSSKSWITRVQAKSEDTRRQFDLPETEQLMDEFHCALRKKVLLQGRLYVFEHYVCFHSNLFGHVKDKVIPLELVTSIKKKKNVGFKNSIELVWNDKKEFFTSFLSREDAYRLIVFLWQQCSPHAKHFVEEADPEYVARVKMPKSFVRWSASHSDSRGEGVSLGVSKLLRQMTGKKRTSVSDDHGDHDDNDDDGPAAHEYGATRGDGGSDNESPSMSYESEMGANSFRPGLERRASDGGPEGGDADDDDAQQEGEDDDFHNLSHAQSLAFGQEFDIASDPAPTVPSEMHHILSFDLSNCTPRQFWTRFLSNDSDFFVEFYRHRGDKHVKMSKWQQHVALGPVRELQFVTSLKMRLGPPQTLCHQSQRYKVFANDHLLFETTQVMADIPYANTFRVEMRWDITKRGQGSHVEIHAHVPFTKTVMWRKFIEKGVMESSLESLSMWRDLAQDALTAEQRAAADAQSPARSVAQGETTGADDTIYPHSSHELDALLSKIDPEFHDEVRAMMTKRMRSAALGDQGGDQNDENAGQHSPGSVVTKGRHRRSNSSPLLRRTQYDADGPATSQHGLVPVTLPPRFINWLLAATAILLQAILLFQVNRIARNLGAHAELESVLRTMQTELRTWQAQVQALTTGIAEALDRAA